jgi:predicted GIY-YIG superfamily endonuclease
MPTRGVSSSVEQPPDAPAYLYVLEDEGRCVYVGVTCDLRQRWFGHQSMSYRCRDYRWFTSTTSIRPLVLTHRGHAFVLEARLIAVLKPVGNHVHNPTRSKLAALKLTLAQFDLSALNDEGAGAA